MSILREDARETGIWGVRNYHHVGAASACGRSVDGRLLLHGRGGISPRHRRLALEQPGSGHRLHVRCSIHGAVSRRVHRSRKHLDLEKKIRRAVAMTLDVVPGFVSVGSTVHITLLNVAEARIEVVLRRHFGGEVPEVLAQTIAADVLESASCHCDVTVEVVPLLTASNRESVELATSARD